VTSALPELTLSLSALFAGLPIAERPAAAVALGYRSLESWWAWPDDAPATETRAFRNALDESGSNLYLVNVAEGDPAHGGRGLVSLPDASDAFWRNCDSVLALVQLTGAKYINVLAGNRSGDDERSRSVLVERLARLAVMADALGAGLLVEPLNSFDHPDYLLVDPDAALAVVADAQAAAGRGSIGLLADLYHLGRSTPDLVEFVRTNAAQIHHVQVADAPGRGRPGAGSLPLREAITALVEGGFRGRIGLEYLPLAGEGIPTPAEMHDELSEATQHG
jgi:hydroxypyruvate isomerase